MRKGIFLLIFLACILSGSAVAQTDQVQQQPLPQNQRIPTGVQITNVPPETDQRGTDRQLQREDQGRGEFPGTSREQQAQEYLKLPPEPDIEYQDFVSSSLGYRLPIFGENLFRNVPSTFAPLDHVPVTPDYLIGPGDELLVRAWGQIDVNYRAVVDRTGMIYLPKVGAISVAGVRYDQLQEHLKTSIGRVFKNFDLDVTLGRLRSIQVFVVGQVRRPGTYTVSSLSTLVNALFASGGPSNRGSMRRIVLKRQGKEVTTFDLYNLIAFGDKTKDAQLLPGDVIYISPVGRLVALAGSVNDPAIYELKDHDTLADVLKYAGGLTTTAAGQKAYVDRIDGHQNRSTAEFELSAKGLQAELADGDIVRFLHISPRFDNAITLRGNVAVPGRYPWRQGMRIRDLIPSREFLITQEFWKRQNLLAIDPDALTFRSRDEVRQKPDEAQDVVPAEPPLAAQDSKRNPQNPYLAPQASRTEAQRITQEKLKNDIKRSAAEINWEYAVVQRFDVDNLSSHLVPFNLGKAIAGDETQNLVLQPGDVITVFSQSDLQVPIGQQSKFVRLEGEFSAAGVYQILPAETLRHLITRVGGLTPQAYLYGSEFTRESTREDQQRRLDEYVNDLERNIERNASGQRNLSGDEAISERQALEGQRRLVEKLRALRATGRIVLELRPMSSSVQELPDLVLEDGDRLVVPFRPATVNVLGAVYNNNSFVFKPGKTVGDYLRLSGGANRDADKKRTFVIRADGTTLGGQSFGTLTRSFNDVRLMPGDSVIVPEKLDKGAVARGFRDWTQVITSFVLGAAAVKVLLQ